MDLEKYWLHQLVSFTIYCSRWVVAKKLGGRPSCSILNNLD